METNNKNTHQPVEDTGQDLGPYGHQDPDAIDLYHPKPEEGGQETTTRNGDSTNTDARDQTNGDAHSRGHDPYTGESS
jgi:hypothetical protein